MPVNVTGYGSAYLRSPNNMHGRVSAYQLLHVSHPVCRQPCHHRTIRNAFIVWAFAAAPNRRLRSGNRFLVDVQGFG
jgi:hypothetical protein